MVIELVKLIGLCGTYRGEHVLNRLIKLGTVDLIVGNITVKQFITHLFNRLLELFDKYSFVAPLSAKCKTCTIVQYHLAAYITNSAK